VKRVFLAGSSRGIALAAGLLLAGPVAAAQQQPAATAAPSAEPAVPTISTGQKVDLSQHLGNHMPTVFVFFNAARAADKELVDSLTRRAIASPIVALRLIRLDAVRDAPIAREYAITETPTMLVFDRRGKQTARTGDMAELSAAVGAALRMTGRIAWVDERDPRAPDVYKNLGGGRGAVPEILKTMSLQPQWMEHLDQLSRKAVFSDTNLPRRTKEMIATYVSSLNRCKY
jgi:alkylhydroperoxidase/carboxymuconolactone decarboxylase family protein YurZ